MARYDSPTYVTIKAELYYLSALFSLITNKLEISLKYTAIYYFDYSNFDPTKLNPKHESRMVQLQTPPFLRYNSIRPWLKWYNIWQSNEAIN